ncbi:MAG: terminase large subunit [Pseudomonadota bacterium]
MRAVLDGATPACLFVRQACERHRRDLSRDDLVLDLASAVEACAFIETMPHIKGRWAGSAIRLEPWQVFLVASLFGWRWRESGLRRYRTAYWEVPRKNGKSLLAAPIALYLLTLDGEPGAEVYSAATKLDQAKIVYRTALAMTRRKAAFRAAFGLVPGEQKIADAAGEREMRALEARRLDGMNVHGAIVDELHEHPTPAVWDALDQARGARQQPVLLAITTAGQDLGAVCFEKRGYGLQILAQVLDDDSWFPVVWTIDDGDDPFDPVVWRKANPNLGVSKYVESMETEARAARASALARGAFLRKHLNIWTSEGAAAFDMDAWRSGEREIDWSALSGAAGAPGAGGEGVGGCGGGATAIDLAWRHDFSAVVTAFWSGGRLHLFAKCFATEAAISAPEAPKHWRAWAEAGHLEMVPGAQMDFGLVGREARRQFEHFGAAAYAFDPHYAADLAAALARDYGPDRVIEYRNSPMSMDRPFQRLIGIADDGLVATDGAPVLRWCASNTRVRQAGEFQMPTKERASAKIDPITAACMALGVMTSPAVEPATPVIEIPEDYAIC